ncbi:MAG TPA: hypothetical protein VM532_06805, partial [Burkholderiales bacterium]|nr:hypothetical protein [Burkholderiales bacterium]
NKLLHFEWDQVRWFLQCFSDLCTLMGADYREPWFRWLNGVKLQLRFPWANQVETLSFDVLNGLSGLMAGAGFQP